MASPAQQASNTNVSREGGISEGRIELVCRFQELLTKLTKFRQIFGRTCHKVENSITF